MSKESRIIYYTINNSHSESNRFKLYKIIVGRAQKEKKIKTE